MDKAREYAAWVQSKLFDENTIVELKNEKLEYDAEEIKELDECDIYDKFDNAGCPGLDDE